MPENKYNKRPSSNEYNNIFGTAAHEKQKLRRHILSSRMTKGNHKFQNYKDNERKKREKEIQRNETFGVSLKITIVQPFSATTRFDLFC